MIAEKDLGLAFLRKVKTRIPDLVLFKRETGIGRIGISKRLPVRTFGIPGQCDLWGVWAGAIHIEIELKSSKARLSPKQQEWKEFCLKKGIPHLVLQAIPTESVEETVERWCKRIESTRPKKGVVTLQIGHRPPPTKVVPEETFTRILPPGWKPSDPLF